MTQLHTRLTRALAGAALVAMTAGTAMAQDSYPTDPAALYEAAQDEGSLVWYTGTPINSAQKMAEAFGEAYPGVTVEVVRLPNLQQMQRFSQESASGRHMADVLALDNVSMAALIKNGFIADWKVPSYDDIVPEARMGTQAYAPFYIDTAILYNTNKVSEEEAKLLAGDWNAILDPRFKGRMAVTNQKCAVCYNAVHMFLDPKLADRYGPEFLTKIGEQQPAVYPEINIGVDRVIAGEKDFMVTVFESSVVPKWQEGAPIRWVHPSPTPLSLTSAWSAVSANAPSPNAARLFLDWWMSPEGAKVQQESYGGRSTLKSVPDNRAFTKEPWYDAVTEPYAPDLPRWEANFNADMDMWLKAIGGAK